MKRRKMKKNPKELMRGSLTVEATLLLPVFLMAALSILYIIKFALYEEEVQWALTRIGREASLEYALSERRMVPDSVYLTAKAQIYLKDAGVRVSLLRSQFDEESKELCLIADYCARIPFPLICNHTFVFSQQSVSRAFVGITTRSTKTEEDEENPVVYVTRTGRVYHRRLSCTYLTLSISQVKFGDLDDLRSENGGKYYACETCAEDSTFMDADEVYICNYGDRFHKRRSCSKLRRSIEEIPLSEVGNRLPCSKCGEMEE